MRSPKKTISLVLAFVFLSLAALSAADFSAADTAAVTCLLGDANGDSTVNIIDATDIQRALAELGKIANKNFYSADVDRDSEMSVIDATYIQKWLVKRDIPYRVGKMVTISDEEFTPVKGVDISYANGDVDMKKIKAAGYDFVMIRCGYGENVKYQDDSQFENNVKKAEEAGMPWGVYLYSYALNVEQARDEAQHVLRLLKGKKPTMPIALDMEDADNYKRNSGFPSSKTLVNICKTFLSAIEEAGYYPILYAGLYWLNHYLNDPSLLDEYDVWVAQWNDVCEYSGSTMGIWQYGGEVNYLESNSIDGVGVIDKNIAYKNYPEIIKGGGYNGWVVVGYNAAVSP